MTVIGYNRVIEEMISKWPWMS